GRAVLLRPVHQLLSPERPEVDVFDPANIETFIDEDPGLQRLTVKPADEMPAGGGRAEIDGLIRIDQQNITDPNVISDATNAPGIGENLVRLFGIENHQPFERARCAHGDEWLALGLVFAGGCEEDRTLGVSELMRLIEGTLRRGESALECDEIRELQ